MTYAWYDILGTVGVAVIIVTYVLLQLGKVRSEQLVYSLANAVGATPTLIPLYFPLNFPYVFREFFFAVYDPFCKENQLPILHHDPAYTW